VGPSDLTLALTGRRYRVGFDRQEPEMLEAIQTILAVAHKHGIKAGLHTGSADYASRAIDWGYDLVTAGTDVRLLSEAAGQTVRTVRNACRGQI